MTKQQKEYILNELAEHRKQAEELKRLATLCANEIEFIEMLIDQIEETK